MPQPYRTLDNLRVALSDCLRFDRGVQVTDPGAFTAKLLDNLVRTAVFAEDPPLRDTARWIIRAAAADLGAHPASIQGLYEAIASGKARGFTVPAHNLRGMIYDKARAIFRAAKALDAGAFIFEISRTEMGYCFVPPAEYSACILGAAVREGHRGPVFIQGDHFQFSAREYFQDPGSVTETIKKATAEALDAGFLNIDIDPSTLVVLDRPTVKEQQRDNYERAAEMTEFIRKRQPAGVDVSVGGEIGEVGKKNSTVEEFEAYFEGYRERWSGKPISKMSVQTGTSHGGVVRPDGTREEAAIDFAVLRDITAACRARGLAGTVQHGASTLPERLFPEFPRHDAVEIHLATEFQRIVLDHPEFPRELRAKLEGWIEETRPPEWKADATKAQNFEKCAKRTWGPFKKELWSLPPAAHEAIVMALEAKFRAIFTHLNVKGTRAIVAEHVKTVPVLPPKPQGL